MELNLDNKVAIITGGASGLGRRTAELLLQEKVRVFIADQNESEVLVDRRLTQGMATW